MKNKKRLMYASLIGVASVLACVVQAADTVVTNSWNVTAWTNGPTLEQFSSLPSWASNEALVAGTARPDSRFWLPTSPEKVLSFATLGITNTFSGAKIQPGTPIFIDMRCRLNPFDTTPPAMEPNTVLCFYANQTSNLVVASYSKTNTTAIIVDPAEYYSILIRFASDTFDVFFNNDTVVAASLNATTNEISKMVISGAGEMDDLYVSYGDPKRTWTNSLVSVTGFAEPPSAEELVISNWIANKVATGSYTKDSAYKYYLTDGIPTSEPFAGELGIGSFSYDPNKSNVTVVVTLRTGADSATTKKSGKINGLLGLKGAGDYNTAKVNGWVDIATKTILTNDFLNGVATYKFELTGDANTNKFFLPVIKSNIK